MFARRSGAGVVVVIRIIIVVIYVVVIGIIVVIAYVAGGAVIGQVLLTLSFAAFLFGPRIWARERVIITSCMYVYSLSAVVISCNFVINS